VLLRPEVGWLRLEDVGHERLRIAVLEREPGALHLRHQAMARSEAIELLVQVHVEGRHGSGRDRRPRLFPPVSNAVYLVAVWIVGKVADILTDGAISRGLAWLWVKIELFAGKPIGFVWFMPAVLLAASVLVAVAIVLPAAWLHTKRREE
jgi:hypothetical protein